MKGENKIKKKSLLIKHTKKEIRLLEEFSYDLIRIPKVKNDQMDTLANLANVKATINNWIIIQETLWSCWLDGVMNIEQRDSWIAPMVSFLRDWHLLDNKGDAKKGKHQAMKFFLGMDSYKTRVPPYNF